RHPALHQTAHNRPEYSVQTAPRVSGKYHGQSRPDDWDRLILASAVLRPDKVSFAGSQYHLDATSSVPEYAAEQDIANWSNRNSQLHWRLNSPDAKASRHIFHNAHPSYGAWSSVPDGILWQ